MRELLSKKDFNLIIRAIDRVWSRSLRYKEILHSYRIVDDTPNKDGSTRKKPLYWIICDTCKGKFRAAEIQIDHSFPVVPVYTTTWEMNIDYYIQRRHCSPKDNLRPLCKPCHKVKSKYERQERKKWANK